MPPTLRQRLRTFFAADSPSPRPPARLFWTAFLLRVLYMTLAHTFRMRLIHDHFEFGWEMGRIARALVTGYGYADPFNGHSGPTAWTPPLYPLLIAAVFKLFGIYTNLSAWILLTINCVFSAAVAPLVYELGWRTFGRTQGGWNRALWSGWLWALYPAAMQYSVKWIWDMSLTVFLFTWVLVLALRMRGLGEPQPKQTSTLPRWLLFGLLWGLIALSNSSLLTFLPACALWIAWPQLRTSTATTLRNLLLSGVCCAAVFSPWIIRNWFAFHAFIPLRANLGAELSESVDPGNNGFPWGATISIAEASPQFQRYKTMGEVAYSKSQGESAKQVIRSHPKRFWSYVLKRIFFFWNSVPHPAEANLPAELIREANYAFLSISGILGLLLALRQRLPAATLYALAFLFLPLIYYFVTVQARFRHPLEPIITVLTVHLFQSARPSQNLG